MYDAKVLLANQRRIGVSVIVMACCFPLLQRHERHRSLTHSGLLFSRINVQFHPV